MRDLPFLLLSLVARSGAGARNTDTPPRDGSNGRGGA